jgi:LysM repeat protein
MVKWQSAAFLVAVIIFSSCRSSRPAVTPVTPTGSAADYIEKYKGLAVSEMKRTGVPASITLAQGLIESGMGKGTLAVEANNHFGIKCHDDWDGPTVRHDDDRRNECFRKYKTPAESFRDHSDFLRKTPRYSFLFDLQTTDYKGWAKGLRKAGYATNPDYANMLIERIEKYGLNRFDKPGALASEEVRKEKPVDSVDTGKQDTADTRPPLQTNGPVISYCTLSERIQENNRIQYIVARQNDTREKIEKELNLLKWELPKYNELENDFSVSPGQLLYLQPKRDKAEAGKEIHVVKEGETMYQISQIYGIKIRKLYMMNRMEEGSQPGIGQKLWLRSLKPVG